MTGSTGGWNPEQTQPLRKVPGALGPSPLAGGGPATGGAPIFGEFQLLRKIGSGGVGEVYQAVHLPTQKTGILKRLRDDQMAQQAAQQRFDFEIELGKVLRHPGLVQVAASGRAQGRQYLFMTEVAGPSLRRLLTGHAPWQVTTANLIEALEQVGRAVAFVHRAGVVHCDLKPENILFQSIKQPVVIDFGLAFRPGDPAPTKSAEIVRQSGFAMGTPMYMAPELLAGGKGEPTPAVDIYAFGVMLFEVLAGRPPFLLASGADRQGALMRLMEQVVQAPPPLIRKFRPEVTEAWEVLCWQCLQKKPGKRPSSMEAVARDVGLIHRTGKPAKPSASGLRWVISQLFE